MNENFQKALKLVLKHEGGYVNYPRDPGGATNLGITLANFKRYVKPGGTIADLKKLTVEQASIVYRRQYWDVVLGAELPAGVDYAVFDFAVNSGPRRAAEFLQRACGADVDGKIGPVTISAVYDWVPYLLIENLCDARLAWLKRIKTWPTFGKGWGRRVEGVRREALKMATRN